MLRKEGFPDSSMVDTLNDMAARCHKGMRQELGTKTLHIYYTSTGQGTALSFAKTLGIMER